MAGPDDEVEGYLSQREEREQEEGANSEKGKAYLPKFAPHQPFDGVVGILFCW